MTPQLAEKPTVFRIGHARDIVNPLVNRLWIVPVVPEGASQVTSKFAAIQSELVDLYKSLGHRRLIVHLLAPFRPSHRLDEHLGCIAFDNAAGAASMVLAHGTDLPEQKRLEDIIVRAGEALPDHVRKTLLPTHASTPFAVWMLALWKYSTLGPFQLMDVPNRMVGIQWLDPIAESLFVIDKLKLAKPRVDDLNLLESEWSAPMSKAEFGKRVLAKTNARARDVDPIFDSFEKLQVSDKKWMFRLDKLAAATRRKLEGGSK